MNSTIRAISRSWQHSFLAYMIFPLSLAAYSFSCYRSVSNTDPLISVRVIREKRNRFFLWSWTSFCPPREPEMSRDRSRRNYAPSSVHAFYTLLLFLPATEAMAVPLGSLMVLTVDSQHIPMCVCVRNGSNGDGSRPNGGRWLVT